MRYEALLGEWAWLRFQISKFCYHGQRCVVLFSIFLSNLMQEWVIYHLNSSVFLTKQCRLCRFLLYALRIYIYLKCSAKVLYNIYHRKLQVLLNKINMKFLCINNIYTNIFPKKVMWHLQLDVFLCKCGVPE